MFSKLTKYSIIFTGKKISKTNKIIITGLIYTTNHVVKSSLYIFVKLLFFSSVFINYH